MKAKIFSILTIVLLALTAYGFAEVKLSASIDRNKICLGDPLKYTLTLEYRPEDKFTPPNPETFNFEPFSVRDFVAVPQPDKDGMKVLQYVFQLTVYDTGKFEIPELKVEYPGAAGPATASTSKLAVEVVKVPAKPGEKTDQVRPDKTIEKVNFPFWYYLAAGFILLGIIILLFILAQWLKKKQKAASEIVVPPHQLALNEINQLEKEDLPARELWKDYYSRLSGILREYLEARFGLNALEQTTWEVIRDMRCRNLKADAMNLTGEVLSLADLVKFAKYLPELKRSREDLEATKRLIEITRPLEIETKSERGEADGH